MVVGTLSDVDPDAGDTAVFTLVDDAGGRFAIDGTNLLVAGPLDYELASSLRIKVSVADSVGQTFQQDFTIAITDVPGVTLVGDAAENSLVGTPEADTLIGLGGADELQGLAGDDILDGGDGFDRAVYSDATSGMIFNLASGVVSGSGVGTDSLIGIEGIVGTSYADTFIATGFTGFSGAPGTAVGLQEFQGGAGDDMIIGLINSQGQALTRLCYLDATNGVTVDFAAGKGTGDASVGTDTFTGVDAVFGSGFDDVLRGTDNGFGTFELFEGRGGNDLIDGRGGYDRVDYFNDPATTTGISVSLAAGVITGDASVGRDTLRNIEGVRGTNFDDVYDARGFSGASINAGSLGTFNDFAGSGGNDTIYGNGFTRLTYTNAFGPITADIAAGTATGDGTDTFSGVNAVMGSVFGDTLLGSANVVGETFTGLGGDDYIDGRGGFDMANYNNVTLTTGGVSVDMASGIATGDASIGTDTLRSIEAIQGTNFADTYVATGFGVSGALNIGSNGTLNQFEGLAGTM